MAFVAALAATLFFALNPHPPALPIDRWGDKFEHMAGFAVLTVLARISFPRMAGWLILVRLSFLGACIEMIQALPSLHRDCDWRDWLADTLAVAAVLVALALLRGGESPRD
jgi:hypothetical protein